MSSSSHRRRLLLVPLLVAAAALWGPLTAGAGEATCKAWLVQSIPTDMPQLRRVPGVLSTGILRSLGLYPTPLSCARLRLFGYFLRGGVDGCGFAVSWGLGARPACAGMRRKRFAFDTIFLVSSSSRLVAYSNLIGKAMRNGGNVWVIDFCLLFGSTGDVLQWLSGNATKNLDILAQYWQFLAQPNNPKSGDYGFTDNDMKRFGADEGRRVYKALENAADRKIKIRQELDLILELSVQQTMIGNLLLRSPVPLSVDIPYTVGYPELANPEMIDVPFETPGSKKSTQEHYLSYLSFAPPEVTFDKFQADEQGWVDTIKSVKVGGIVRMNTMDWLGQSQYATETVYWPALSSAISEVVFSKNATVRLLVAYWTHFIPNTEKYLKSLLYSNILCASSKYNHCGGKVEIKYYIVPGYNNTGPALSQGGAATGNLYPDFTRVNHGKYAVSDVRANIGTSNLIWDYFYTTAGVSFGTYNPSIVSQLQDIFDADWYSPYTVPVKPLESSV
nr:unnamed protein product [Digitaria exilis]